MSSESYHMDTDLSREEALDQLADMDRRMTEMGKVMSTLRDRLVDVEAENEQLRGTVETLQARVDVLEGDAANTGKETKVKLLVNHAENLAGKGQRGVILTARDIKGATGVTRRYAYDLMDDLPQEYHFLLDRDELQQYGDLEIDKDAQDRGLFVDLERLHSDGEAVNLFTTPSDGNGGSR